MTIKASKCHSFDICKKGTNSTQYKPKLDLDHALVDFEILGWCPVGPVLPHGENEPL